MRNKLKVVRMLQRQLVPSTGCHPNMPCRNPEPQIHPPEERNLFFQLLLVSYPSLYPRQQWLSHTWAAWPGCAGQLLEQPYCVAYSTAPNLSPGVMGGSRTTAKPSWSSTQGQLFLPRHHGGHAQGQHPRCAHPIRNGGSVGLSTELVAKSQETGKAKCIQGAWGLLNGVRNSVAF